MFLQAIPYASAHGVCGGFAPRYVRLEHTTLSKQTLQTGENFTITGNMTALTGNDLKGHLFLQTKPGPHGRLVISSIEPSSSIFDIPENSTIPYSITVTALLPGNYFVSSGLDLIGIGPTLLNNGCSNTIEPNLTVTGNPICTQGLVTVTKTEDDTSACVTLHTAQELMERGWAKQENIGVSAFAHPPVGISNLTLSTNPIILGIPFYISADITNYQNAPITYYGGCISPLSVFFDNIKTSPYTIHCNAMSQYTLQPNQSAHVQSNKIETVYNATGPNAITHAQIKFSYKAEGQQYSVFTSTEIPIQNAIMIGCSGERVQLHMAQIDKTVNATKAVALAYTSPEFLSKVKQYGNLSYSGFYNDWFSSESCHTYWNGTEVMFGAKDDSNGTRNIQVTEDINQTKVLKVSDFLVTPTK